jgi:hypothetical protein
MTRIRQFATLSRLSAVEAARQPLCLLLTSACVLLSTAAPLLSIHRFGESAKLARDSAQALHFVFGLFLAGCAASSALTRGARSGTVSDLLSMPVSRDLVFLARFAGVAGVLVAFSLCASLATLLSDRIAERSEPAAPAGYVTDRQTALLLFAAVLAAYAAAGILNYRQRAPFGSTGFGLLILCLIVAFGCAGFFDRAGRYAPFDLRVQWRLVPASALITLALLVLCAVALALSTRLDATPTLAACVGLFFAGLMSDYLLGRFVGASWAADLAYRIVPNWQHFWLSDALTAGGTIPLAYVAEATGYAALYAAAALCLGVAAFRQSDVA